MMTTSAGSPRASRLGIASGDLPIDGPSAVSSVLPVLDANFGPSALYAAVKPPELMTCRSAACTLVATAELATSAVAHSFRSRFFMTGVVSGERKQRLVR